MSKANLLAYKRTPVLSIANKQKTPSQHTITYRDINKDDDSQKLYTFCSSQQKQAGQNIEDSRDLSRGRKISFNNTRGKIYQPLSKSKGKTSSQANIHKQRKKQLSNFSMTNTSAILNSSAIIQRRKTDKPNAREFQKDNDDNRINISINLSRNGFNQPKNKEKKLEINNILQDKHFNQKNILFQSNFNKQNKGENNEGKKMIVMSQQQLQNFTKKQASDKIKLQQKIQQLESNIKQLQDKERDWRLFKKDSEQYIKYLVKEKDEVLNRYQNFQEEVKTLRNDQLYHQMAKEQYRCTINEQQAEIHQLKREINNYKEQIERLSNQLDKQVAGKQNNDASTSLQLLHIQNSYLKKQLQINEKHRSTRNSHRFELQNLQKQLQDLKMANQILSSEIKETYIFKLKCDVFEKTQQQSTNTIAKLIQENESLRSKQRDKYKSVKFQESEVGDFYFRLDTSPHSPSEVEVVWKRDFQQEKENYSKSSRVQDYFDHDFFSGFNRQKI